MAETREIRDRKPFDPPPISQIVPDLPGTKEVRRGREGGQRLRRSRVLGYDRRVGMAKTEIPV
jgi:hypothetical protein